MLLLVPGESRRAETGGLATHNEEVLSSADEQLNQTFYCTEGVSGVCRVANLGTGEWGFYIFVSVMVRSPIYAKLLQGTTSCLHHPERRVLVAWRIDASKRSTGGGGRACLPFLVQEELQFCQVFCWNPYHILPLIKGTVGRAVVCFCDCWVRKGWRWEVQSCHYVPVGKLFAPWHNGSSLCLPLLELSPWLSSAACLHYKLGLLPIVPRVWTVDCKPDLRCQWAEQLTQRSLLNALGTSPGKLGETKRWAATDHWVQSWCPVGDGGPSSSMWCSLSSVPVDPDSSGSSVCMVWLATFYVIIK